MLLDIIAITIGILGTAFGVKCYIELHKWARICQRARIFIAYNNKVKLDAPFTDWIQWTRMLNKDEGRKGRIIYQANKLRVGILHDPDRKPDKTTVTPVKTPAEKAAA